jgi:ADP-ribosylglycohydrolase
VTADAQLLTRARAALLGLVVGNQLGVPTEYLGTAQAAMAPAARYEGERFT